MTQVTRMIHQNIDIADTPLVYWLFRLLPAI